MSNIVSTTAKDGSTVEFNYENPKSGAMKDVYFAPDKSYVVAFYKKQLDYAGLSRLEKLVGKYREQIFESEGPPSRKSCKTPTIKANLFTTSPNSRKTPK